MSENTAIRGAVSEQRLVVRAVLRTDVGKIRSENQDFGTLTGAEEGGSSSGRRLLVVADGMGGHRGGATASRLAGETIRAYYLASTTTDDASTLREALVRANAKIFAEAQANPDLRGMGTTTSALAVRGNQAWFGHVGDSRIYLMRGGEISQLTDDHSLVAAMVREGLLTSKEAETHPRRNVLQRSMGVSEEVEVDIRGPFDLQEGDTFLLCSDGLHGVVKEDELRDIARLPLERAADEFIRLALERGGPDNVTVIVARAETAANEGESTLLDRENDDDVLFDETVRETADSRIEDDVDANIDAALKTRAPGASVPVTAPDASSPHVSVREDAVVEAAPRAVPAAEVVPSIPVAASVAASEEGATIEAAAAEATAVTEPRPVAPAAPAVPVHRSTGRAIVKWTLLFLIVLGAAGAWLFWSQQQGFARQKATSSSR